MMRSRPLYQCIHFKCSSHSSDSHRERATTILYNFLTTIMNIDSILKLSQNMTSIVMRWAQLKHSQSGCIYCDLINDGINEIYVPVGSEFSPLGLVFQNSRARNIHFRGWFLILSTIPMICTIYGAPLIDPVHFFTVMELSLKYCQRPPANM